MGCKCAPDGGQARIMALIKSIRSQNMDDLVRVHAESLAACGGDTGKLSWHLATSYAAVNAYIGILHKEIDDLNERLEAK